MSDRTPRSELKQAIKILEKARLGHWGKDENGWHSGSKEQDRVLVLARQIVKGEVKTVKDFVEENPIDRERVEAYKAQMLAEVRAFEGDEVFEAEQHWVNNPLISPINKVDMFNEAVERAERDTQERIVKLLNRIDTDDTFRDYWFGCLGDDFKGDGGFTQLIALLNAERQKDKETVVLLTEGENE